MPACMWATLITESAYKVPTTTPVLNKDRLVLELTGDDPVSAQEMPNSEELRTWLACNDPDRLLGETATFNGTIRTLLYPEQAPVLLRWALQRIDQAASPALPWTTAEPFNQFGSMCLDYAYYDDANAIRKEQWLGGKVNTMTITASRNTQDGAFILTADCTFASRTASTATEPLPAEYPDGAPYFISATSGGVTINGNVISNYETITIGTENINQVRYDEGVTVSRIRAHGRTITTTLEGLLKFTPDLRQLALTRAVFPAEVVMTHSNGTHSITFGMPRSTMPRWERGLPIAADRTQSLDMHVLWDRTTEETLNLSFDPDPLAP